MQLLWSKSPLQRAHGGFCLVEQRVFLQIQRGDGEISNWSVHPTDAEQRTSSSTSTETHTEKMRDEEVTWWQARYRQWGKTPDTRAPCKTGEDNKMWQAEVWVNLLRNNPPFWQVYWTAEAPRHAQLPRLGSFKLARAPMRTHSTVISALASGIWGKGDPDVCYKHTRSQRSFLTYTTPAEQPSLPGITEPTVLTTSKHTTKDFDPKEEKMGRSREETKQPITWKLSDRITVK